MFGASSAPTDCVSVESAVFPRGGSTRPPKLPKWNEETTLKFVRLYKQHESLWNTFLPEYKDKYRRYLCSKSIANQMALAEFGPSEVPRKIKILRSTYYQELLKIEKSKSNGDDNVYVPALRWFSIMDDILKNLPHKRHNFTASDYLTEDDRLNGSEIEPDAVDTNNIVVKTESADDGNIEIHEIIHRENTARPPAGPSPRSVRNARRASKRRIACRSKRLSGWTRRPASTDEFAIFGKHVAAQLRRLEEEECVAAQEQIQSVLSQARLRTLQRYHNSHHYSQGDYLSHWPITDS